MARLCQHHTHLSTSRHRSSTAPPRTVTLVETDALYESLPSHARARFGSPTACCTARIRDAYRRAETTAYALSQLLARHRARFRPRTELPRRSAGAKAPGAAPGSLPLCLLETAEHADLPFPTTRSGACSARSSWPSCGTTCSSAQTLLAQARASCIGVINSHHAMAFCARRRCRRAPPTRALSSTSTGCTSSASTRRRSTEYCIFCSR